MSKRKAREDIGPEPKVAKGYESDDETYLNSVLESIEEEVLNKSPNSKDNFIPKLTCKLIEKESAEINASMEALEELIEEKKVIITRPLKNLLENSIKEEQKNALDVARSVKPEERLKNGNYRKISFAGGTSAGKSFIINNISMSLLADSEIYTVQTAQEEIQKPFGTNYFLMKYPLRSSSRPGNADSGDCSDTSNSVTFYTTTLRYADRISVVVHLLSLEELEEKKELYAADSRKLPDGAAENLQKVYTEVKKQFDDKDVCEIYRSPRTEKKLCLFKEIVNASDTYSQICDQNKFFIKKVVYNGPFNVLDKDVEMTDTPGLSDIHYATTSIEYLRESDVICFVGKGRRHLEHNEIDLMETIWDYAKFRENMWAIPRFVHINNITNMTTAEWLKDFEHISREGDKTKENLQNVFRNCTAHGDTVCGSIQGIFRERLFDLLAQKADGFAFFGHYALLKVEDKSKLQREELFCNLSSFRTMVRQVIADRVHDELQSAFRSLQYVSYALWDQLKSVNSVTLSKNPPKRAVNSIYNINLDKKTVTEEFKRFACLQIEKVQNLVVPSSPKYSMIRDAVQRRIQDCLTVILTKWVKGQIELCQLRAFAFFQEYVKPSKNKLIKEYNKDDWEELLGSSKYDEELSLFQIECRSKLNKNPKLPTKGRIVTSHKNDELFKYIYRYVYVEVEKLEFPKQVPAIAEEATMKIMSNIDFKAKIQEIVSQAKQTKDSSRIDIDITTLMKSAIDVFCNLQFTRFQSYKHAHTLKADLFQSRAMLNKTKLITDRVCACLSDFFRGKGRNKRREELRSDKVKELFKSIAEKKKKFDDIFRLQDRCDKEESKMIVFSDMYSKGDLKQSLPLPPKILNVPDKPRMYKIPEAQIKAEHQNFEKDNWKNIEIKKLNAEQQNTYKRLMVFTQVNSTFELAVYDNYLEELSEVLKQPRDKLLYPLFIASKNRHENRQAFIQLNDGDTSFTSKYIVYVFVEDHEVESYLSSYNNFSDESHPDNCILVLVSIPGKSRGIKFARSLVFTLQLLLRKELKKRNEIFDYWLQSDDDVEDARLWNVDSNSMQYCSLKLAYYYAQEAFRHFIEHQDTRFDKTRSDLKDELVMKLYECAQKKVNPFEFSRTLSKFKPFEVLEFIDGNNLHELFEKLNYGVVSEEKLKDVYEYSKKMKKESACRFTQLSLTMRKITNQSNYNIHYHKEKSQVRVSDQLYSFNVNYTPGMIGYNYMNKWEDMLLPQDLVDKQREMERKKDESKNAFLGEDKGIIARMRADNRVGLLLYNFDILFSQKKNGGCEEFRASKNSKLSRKLGI